MRTCCKHLIDLLSLCTSFTCKTLSVMARTKKTERKRQVADQGQAGKLTRMAELHAEQMGKAKEDKRKGKRKNATPSISATGKKRKTCTAPIDQRTTTKKKHFRPGTKALLQIRAYNPALCFSSDEDAFNVWSEKLPMTSDEIYDFKLRLWSAYRKLQKLT